MTHALATLRAAKLLANRRCPVCGAARREAIGAVGSRIAICVYSCSAEFVVDVNGEIVPLNVCPAASHVAAQALNRESKAEAARKAGAA